MKAENTLKDFDPSLRHALKNTIEQMDFLDILTKDDNARVPEPAFIKFLLPILTNRKGNQSLVPWQEIAGNVMRAIDVIDPSGNVLFTVPPVLRTYQEDSLDLKGMSLQDILITAERKSKFIPAQGKKHFDLFVLNNVKRNHALLADVKTWNSILARYGYAPLIALEGETSEKETSGDGPDQLAIDGYDDL